MADRVALVIGLDSSQAAHAEADALAFARALEAIGFPRDAVTTLVAGQATRTAIESRLRKLTRTEAGDLLVIFHAGPGFAEEERGYLECHDTQSDDRADTGLPLKALLDAACASPCRRVVLFLDVRGDGFPLAEIEAFCAARPAAVCFLSHVEGEQSHISGSLKSGIWAHHVIEAFTGKAPRTLDSSHVLTAAKLQAYLNRELPRTLRATFREAPAQTPTLIGPAGGGAVVLADVSVVLSKDGPVADPRLQPLKRGALRSEATSKVKSLTGFRKFHRLPDRVNAGSRKFVADLAHEDVKQDVDDIYAAVREQLGYKRRDVEGSADRGTGFVRTPDFEYSVSIELADDDPTSVIWRREVAGIKTPEVVLGRPFQQVFGSVFDTLVFEFTRPFDLEAWVDHLEDDPPEGVKVRTASDCSSCDISVRGKACVVRLFRDRVEIQGGRKEPGSQGLVESFLHFQGLFAGRRDLQELPLLPG